MEEFLSISFFIICGIGSLNYLFLSAYLLFTGRENRISKTVLVLFFLLNSLRVFKSVIVYFVVETHVVYHILWYCSQVFVPLLIFLFLFSLVSKLTVRRLLPHIIVPAVYLVILIVIPSLTTELYVVHLTTLYKFVYLVLSVYIIKNSTGSQIFSGTAKLHFIVFWTILLLDVIMFSAFVLTRYKVLHFEAILYALASYVFVAAEMNSRALSKARKTASLPEGISEKVLLAKLNAVTQKDKVHLDPNLTLARLAARIRTTPHILSYLINEHLGKNYNDYINCLRIEESVQRLKQPENSEKTISTIAYECGFNSLSVFNPVFKKVMGQTPSQFRSEQNCGKKS